MTKPIFDLPVPTPGQTTKQLLDGEANRVTGILYDAIAAGATEEVIADLLEEIQSIKDAAVTARTGSETARTGAVTAQGLAEAARDSAQASARTSATWSALSALTGSQVGEGAEVLDSDTGTHTDPVVGGTVNNSGRYTWSAAPAGWERIGATGLAGKAPASEVIVSAAESRFFGGAGNLTSTGAANAAFGHLAGRDISTGAHNVIMGNLAGYQIQTGSENVILGRLAVRGAAATSNTVAIGARAAEFCTGNETVAIGRAALLNATVGGNTAVGTGAGASNISGQRQTLIGLGSSGGSDLNDVIAIGHNATATQAREIALGAGTQRHLRMFGIPYAYHNIEADLNNHYLLRGEPINTPTGARNLSIGPSAGGRFISATNNIAIGFQALELHTGDDPVPGKGNNTIAIGVAAFQLGTALADAVAIGVLAGRTHVTGTGATLVGFRASQFGAGSANATAVGDSALWVNTGGGNTAMGYVVAEYNQTADESIFLGRATARFRNGSSNSVFIGHGAGGLFSHAASIDTITGAGAPPAGDDVVAVGHNALNEYMGGEIVAVGSNAGRTLVATAAHVSNSVFVGPDAGYNAGQKPDAQNSIAIGAGVFTTKDNQAVLGNANISETIIRGVQRGTVYTVAGLPLASDMGVGARSFVTDAASPVFGDAVVGSGAVPIPVYSDGTIWRVG